VVITLGGVWSTYYSGVALELLYYAPKISNSSFCGVKLRLEGKLRTTPFEECSYLNAIFGVKIPL